MERKQGAELCNGKNQLATDNKIKARIEKYEHLIWYCFCPHFSFRYAPLQSRTKTSIYEFLEKLTHFSWQNNAKDVLLKILQV